MMCVLLMITACIFLVVRTNPSPVCHHHVQYPHYLVQFHSFHLESGRQWTGICWLLYKYNIYMNQLKTADVWWHTLHWPVMLFTSTMTQEDGQTRYFTWPLRVKQNDNIVICVINKTIHSTGESRFILLLDLFSRFYLDKMKRRYMINWTYFALSTVTVHHCK